MELIDEVRNIKNILLLLLKKEQERDERINERLTNIENNIIEMKNEISSIDARTKKLENTMKAIKNALNNNFD
jgi:predicted  nucleic acid-binding Zn-ribbon protein